MKFFIRKLGGTRIAEMSRDGIFQRSTEEDIQHAFQG
jgi:hypothetical protein